MRGLSLSLKVRLRRFLHNTIITATAESSTWIMFSQNMLKLLKWTFYFAEINKLTLLILADSDIINSAFVQFLKEFDIFHWNLFHTFYLISVCLLRSKNDVSTKEVLFKIRFKCDLQ